MHPPCRCDRREWRGSRRGGGRWLGAPGASGGGDLSINGSAFLDANGTGGDGHVGGAARGGSTCHRQRRRGIFADRHRPDLRRRVRLRRPGQRLRRRRAGGDAIGGNSSTIASGGALLDLELLSAFTNAFGGEGATGGNASGGVIQFGATGVGSVLDVNFSTFLLQFQPRRHRLRRHRRQREPAAGSTSSRMRAASCWATCFSPWQTALAAGPKPRGPSAAWAGRTGVCRSGNGGALTVLSAMSLQANGDWRRAISKAMRPAAPALAAPSASTRRARIRRSMRASRLRCRPMASADLRVWRMHRLRRRRRRWHGREGVRPDKWRRRQPHPGRQQPVDLGQRLGKLRPRRRGRAWPGRGGERVFGQ